MSDDHYSLSGKPTLLAGEDNERYLQRRQAIKDYVKPENIIEEMLVDDLVNKHCEEERLQRFSVCAIRAGFRNALKFHLKETGLAESDISSMLKRYFAGSPKNREVIVAHLARHGIAMEDINATAMQYKLDPLQMIDHMRGARENARRLLLKELKKLQKARARADASPPIVTVQKAEA